VVVMINDVGVRGRRVHRGQPHRAAVGFSLVERDGEEEISNDALGEG
jgi:hypothetical protein